jgi:hypothetical protein
VTDDNIEVEREVLLGTDVEKLDCLDVEVGNAAELECQLLLNEEVVELSVLDAVDFVIVEPKTELDFEEWTFELEDEGLKLEEAELQLDLFADWLLDVVDIPTPEVLVGPPLDAVALPNV